MAALLLMLVTVGNATGHCPQLAWESLHIERPCFVEDPIAPTAENLIERWKLAPQDAAMVARAFAADSSSSRALWREAAKRLPNRFEPIGALALVCGSECDDQVLEEIEASSDPAGNFAALASAGRLGARGVVWALKNGAKTTDALRVSFATSADLADLAVALRAYAVISEDSKGRPESRRAWADRVLVVSLKKDLVALASEFYLSLPLALRQAIAKDQQRAFEYREELAVALLISGKREEAAQLAATQLGASPWRDCNLNLRLEALHDVLTGYVPATEFDLRVSLRQCHRDLAASTLLLLRGRLPKDDELLAAYFGNALADSEPAPYFEKLFPPERQVELARDRQLITNAVQPEWKRVLAALEVEKKRYAALSSDREEATAVPSESPFIEKQLRAVASGTGPHCPPLRSGFTKVTARTSLGGGCVEIATSQALDPTGERSDGAYWLFTAKDSGWGRGWYLGLAVDHPYRVISDSPVSIESGVLRLTVQRHPRDDSLVIFPSSPDPTAEGPPVSLEAKLDAVTHDFDHDGLSDLEEERLGLDPRSVDTDGDGIKDGEDLMPNVPGNVPRSPEGELLQATIALLSTQRGEGLASRPVTGSRRGSRDQQVELVAGDPIAWRGVQTRVPMVVQPRKFWDALEVKNGAFFPTTFDVIIDEAGTRAFIDYSMGWRGGSIDAELKDGKWILKSRGSWIT